MRIVGASGDGRLFLCRSCGRRRLTLPGIGSGGSCCGRSGRRVVLVLCAQQVVQDVDDGGDVTFGLAVPVLQRWVQRA